MLFSGMAAGGLVAVVSGRVDVGGGRDLRWKSINGAITRAAADTSRTTMSATLDQREGVTHRTADACFDPFPCLIASGTCALPRLPL
jgi:hypothetical protein